MTVATLAERVGVHEQTAGRWVRGEAEPGIENMKKVAEVTDTPYEWLRTGEGKMRPAPPPAPADWTEAMEEVEEDGFLPVYDIQASAGNGGFIVSDSPHGYIRPAEDSPLYRIEDRNGTYAFFLPIHGTSMHPTLQDGQIVPVRRFKRPPENLKWDAVYVFRYEGQVFVKRLSKMLDGRIEVISDNETFPNRVLDVQPDEDFEILGRVLVD